MGTKPSKTATKGGTSSSSTTTNTTTNDGHNNANINNGLISSSFDTEKAKSKVVEKLQHNEVYSSKLKPNLLKQFAEVLCTEDKLKGTYLTCEWLESVDLAKKILHDTKQVDDDSLAGTSGTGYKSVVNNSAVDSDVEQMNKFSSTNEPIDLNAVEDNEDEDILDQEDINDGSKNPEITKILNQNTIKIKIVISEIARTKGKKAFRRMLSPILSKLDLLPELGMFHSALQVGPWLIEWNNSALCVPRKCVSSAAMLSADIDQLETNEDVRTVVDKLAKVIVKWNATMLYKDRDTEIGKSGNCQDFVDDVLHELGISREHLQEGPLGKFLKELKSKGKSDLMYEMDENFRKKFNRDEKSIVFKTHKDLDEFVQQLLLIDTDFDKNYKLDWMFLKSIDRAFWLKHFKFEDRLEYKPLMQETVDEDNEVIETVECPFKDPRTTYSIIFEN
ncbi:hypothetical protein ABK040_014579 [Willaertia magna]